MAYDPKTQAYQPITRPYKEGLKKLAQKLHRTDRHTVEMLIDQACRAQGIEIVLSDPKK